MTKRVRSFIDDLLGDDDLDDGGLLVAESMSDADSFGGGHDA